MEEIILPKVTSDLPRHPVPLDGKWNHLSGIQLADPDFGYPGNVDILLGVDVFSQVVPPERWHHVSEENPADSASRGLFPSKLLRHEL